MENAVVSAARNGDYVTAGGTKYEYSDIAEAAGSNALDQSLMATATGYDLNGEGYNLYLDPNGYVLGVEGYNGGVNINSYVFIESAKDNGYDVLAKAIFSDGSKKTITVDKLGGADVANAAGITANKFYKFTTSGSNYRLTAVSESTGEVLQASSGIKSSGTELKDIVNLINGNTTSSPTPPPSLWTRTSSMSV